MKNKHKEYENLIQEVAQEIKKVPGFAEILLKTLSLSIKDRIWILDAIKQFLENYPGIKFTGIKVDSQDISQALRMQLKTKFKCLRCKKTINEYIYPVMPPFIMNGIKGKGLVCKDCYFRDAGVEPPFTFLN